MVKVARATLVKLDAKQLERCRSGFPFFILTMEARGLDIHHPPTDKETIDLWRQATDPDDREAWAVVLRARLREPVL